MQVDAAGGLAVEAGVLSMGQSGATPGTYPKVTVDAKGRVTAGANLAAGDLPGHNHTASDIVSGELPHKVQKDGADVGTRRALNLVQSSRVSISAADDPANDRVSVTIGAIPKRTCRSQPRYRSRSIAASRHPEDGWNANSGVSESPSRSARMAWSLKAACTSL